MFSSECPHLSFKTAIGRELGVPTLWFRCEWCGEEYRFQEAKKHIRLFGDLPVTWRFTLTRGFPF